MTSPASSAEDEAPLDLPSGYWVDPTSGAWCSLPWPERPEDLPPSLAPQIIAWAKKNLVHNQTGSPWTFTRGQQRFLYLWYSVADDGRWLYRSAIKRGAKGTGKDPFGAALLDIEAYGPVRFAGWDANGRPKGEPHRVSLVLIGSNSESQSKELLELANQMLSPRLIEDLEIEVGLLLTRSKRTRSRIKVLTASERTAEGDPATFAILNESHHMTASSGGHKLAEVIRRNIGKSPRHLQARAVELTNAHEQGADSVAERSYDAWQAQAAGKLLINKRDILYDSIEAPPTTRLDDIDSLRAGVEAAYMDAPWADIERIIDECADTRTSEADLIRYWLNGIAASESAWVVPANFDALGDTDLTLFDRDEIALFLDCSKSGDSTALHAARLSDGASFALATWVPQKGSDGLVDRNLVDAKVQEVFSRFKVVWFGVDPSPATEDDEAQESYWMPSIDRWHRMYRSTVELWATPGAGGHSVLFDMRQSARGSRERMERFVQMAMQLAQWIDEETETTQFRWARDTEGTVLRTHVHNARRRTSQWGVSLGKESAGSSRKVDQAVTMVGAQLGRRLVLNSNRPTKVRKRANVRGLI